MSGFEYTFSKFLLSRVYTTIYVREVFEIFMVWLHFIWPNLGFAGSCEYLLNKSAQKPWNFLLFKNLSGAWTHKTDRGYEANNAK